VNDFFIGLPLHRSGSTIAVDRIVEEVTPERVSTHYSSSARGDSRRQNHVLLLSRARCARTRKKRAGRLVGAPQC
jgi:hypothetical protein